MAGRRPPVGRVTAKQVAVELDVDWRTAMKLLTRHGWWLHAEPRRIGKRMTYNATVIDKLRALLGQEHRQLEAPESDWLTRYLEEKRNARTEGPP